MLSCAVMCCDVLFRLRVYCAECMHFPCRPRGRGGFAGARGRGRCVALSSAESIHKQFVSMHCSGRGAPRGGGPIRRGYTEWAPAGAPSMHMNLCVNSIPVSTCSEPQQIQAAVECSQAQPSVCFIRSSSYLIFGTFKWRIPVSFSISSRSS